jgi:hypothetical protein
MLSNLEWQDEIFKKVLFRHGDIGDKFYIVVSGKVSFWIPYEVSQIGQHLKYLAEMIKVVTAIESLNKLPFEFGLQSKDGTWLSEVKWKAEYVKDNPNMSTEEVH